MVNQNVPKLNSNYRYINYKNEREFNKKMNLVFSLPKNVYKLKKPRKNRSFFSQIERLKLGSKIKPNIREILLCHEQSVGRVGQIYLATMFVVG